MKTIAYIEPHQDLVTLKKNARHTLVNEFLFNRIKGIMQAVKGDPEIELIWISSKIKTEQFIKGGEYKEYDGVLLTMPGPKVCSLIERAGEGDTAFMISQDSDPGEGLNYTGPDHIRDIENAAESILEENIKKVALVACAPQLELTKSLIRLYLKIFNEKGLYIEENDIIIPPPMVSRLTHGPRRNKEMCGVMPQKMASKKDTRLFVMIDPAPVAGILGGLESKFNKTIPRDFQLLSMSPINAHFPVTSRKIKLNISHYRQDYREIGRRSITALMDIIRGESPRTDNKILVPGKIVQAASFSPAAANETSAGRFKTNVMNYVWRNYSKPISGAAIAAAMNLSYSHFLKKFKADFGTSLAKTVNQVRLDQAAKMIAGTLRPISEILREAGYSNEVTFIRQFKKRFGKTPTEYR